MSNSSEEEAKQVQLLQRGQMSGLKWIYDAYASKMLNLSWRLAGNREAAEDVMHDVFSRLPSTIHSFRGDSLFSTWLYRVVKNAGIQKIIADRRHRELEAWNAPDIFPTPHGPGVEARWEVEEILRPLDPESRSLLWLKEAEGVSIEELALILEVPEGTIKSRLFRLRQKIRSQLERSPAHA